MGELLLIALGAALVNNFVLVQLLGVCPFVGNSQRVEGAIGVALSTGLVLTLTAGGVQLVHRYVLQPYGIEHLRLFALLLVIGAVLGVALINTAASRSFVAALFYGAGAAAGFGLAIVMFAGLRERLVYADVPVAFRGAPITFVTAGIVSLAFMAFAGFARL